MSIEAVLAVDQPLDLDVTLDSGQAFRWRREADGAWLGVVRGGIWRLRQTEKGVAIQATAVPANPESQEDIAAAVAGYLRLDDDLPAIQAELSGDDHVAQGIRANPGLRILRQEPWEALAGFILSSTSNIPRIARTMELLADELGEPLELDGARRKAFPTPDALAAAGEQRLRDLRCGFRASYLIAAATAVASGELALDALRGASYQDTLGALAALPGIADKIADCVMLFSLDHLEAFPIDRWIHRALAEWYGLGEKFDYAKMRAWASERFGPRAGYANQYLYWHIRQSRRPMIGAGLTQPLAPKKSA